LPELWKTAMAQLERVTVAGVGTDITMNDFANNYTGNWESLVEHAYALQADPSIAGTFTDW
jgi:hypothetical protein